MRKFAWIGHLLICIFVMPGKAMARSQIDLEDKTSVIAATLDDVDALKTWLLPKLTEASEAKDARQWVKLWWVYCLLVNSYSFGFSADTHRPLLNQLESLKASALKQQLYDEYFDFILTDHMIRDGGKVSRSMLLNILEEVRAYGQPLIEMRFKSELALALVLDHEYEEGLQRFQQAEQLFSQLQNVNAIDRFVHNTNRSLILMHFEDFDSAEPILTELRQQTYDLGLRSLRLTTTSSLVSAIRNRDEGSKRQGEVEELLLDNLKLAKEIASSWDEAQSRFGLGSLRREQNRHREAFLEAQAAWVVFKNENDVSREANSALLAAQSALALGQLKEAATFAMHSEKALQDGVGEKRGQLDKFWADYYEKAGDGTQARHFLRQYQTWLEASTKQKIQETTKKKLAQIGLRYEQEKSRQRQVELEAQQAVSLWQRMVIVLLLGLCVLVVSLMRGLQKRKREIAALNQYMESKVLRRFLPPDLVKELLASKRSLDDRPKKQTLTVIFADLCSFTHSTEKLGPEKVAIMLNEFFSAMTEVVFRHEGTIDKFMGDGLMIFFGAPKSFPPDEQAHRALACARDMQTTLVRLNQHWQEQYDWTYRMRIGLNQGEAIVGIFGSHERSDYTALGAAVNVASRIENLAEPDQIMISPTLRAYLGEGDARSLGAFSIRGLEKKLELFALQTEDMATMEPIKKHLRI